MKHRYLIISLMMFVLGTTSLTAQQEYLLKKEKSSLKIEGTSNIHDWEMEAKEFKGSTKVVIDGNHISQIKNIEFTCQVGGIESHNRIMDKKTWKALNKEKFPEMAFRMETPKSFESNKEEIEISGKLTIAGTTRETKLLLQAETLSNGAIKLTGKLPLKMSDFNVEPPTAMMGALKTGDNVTITYDFEIESMSENKENI